MAACITNTARLAIDSERQHYELPQRGVLAGKSDLSEISSLMRHGRSSKRVRPAVSFRRSAIQGWLVGLGCGLLPSFLLVEPFRAFFMTLLCGATASTYCQLLHIVRVSRPRFGKQAQETSASTCRFAGAPPSKFQ